MRKTSTEWLDGGSDHLISTGAAMPARRKSFADIIREGLDRPATMSAHLSRSPSRNSFDNTLCSMVIIPVRWSYAIEWTH